MDPMPVGFIILARRETWDASCLALCPMLHEALDTREDSTGLKYCHFETTDALLLQPLVP